MAESKLLAKEDELLAKEKKVVICLEDNALIKRLQENDNDAIEIIINKYNKLLWVIAGSILRNIGTTSDIEECISDVYVALWENPKLYNSKKGTLKTFLSVVTKNKALDRYRKLSKNKVFELNEAVHADDDDLMKFIVEKEMSQKLYEAIKLLTDPDKEIMIRRYFFDEKTSFIAKELSLPTKEVENKLYRCKIKLKKYLISKGVEDCGF